MKIGKLASQLLEESIKKWEGIVEGKKWKDCPLCELYYHKQTPEKTCRHCPVYKKTKAKLCLETPFIKWRYNKTKENAIKELNFLKSLRND